MQCRFIKHAAFFNLLNAALEAHKGKPKDQRGERDEGESGVDC